MTDRENNYRCGLSSDKGGPMNEGQRAVYGGAIAGMVATAAMSATMLVAHRFGLMHEPPPQRIADAALAVAGGRQAPDWLRKSTAAAGHFGFGAALGAAFATLQRHYPAPLAAPVRGMLLATTVWFVSYQGWVPALGIMPSARRDQPGRPLTMLVAHWIYGATLGFCVGQARRTARETTASR